MAILAIDVERRETHDVILSEISIRGKATDIAIPMRHTRKEPVLILTL